MKDSVNFTARVESVEGGFLATTESFPDAKGRGTSKGLALESLRVSVRSLLEGPPTPAINEPQHPLWATILQWRDAAPPPTMPFLPEGEFHAALEAFKFDATINHQLVQTYCETAILGFTLVGGDYDESVHQTLYAAAEHSLGFALSHAAGSASRIPQFFAEFSKSTAIPGFLKALEAWAVCNELTKPFDGAKELKWINRNLTRREHPSATYWQNACQGGFEDIGKFNRAFVKEVLGAEEAAAGDSERRASGIKVRHAEFLHLIKILWVPGALWCLSDSEIVAILDPDRLVKMSDAYDTVRRNICTLKLTRSRLRLK